MEEQKVPGQEPLSKINSDKVVGTSSGLAIASLVLGILSIVMSIFLIGAILGIIGCLLGIVHLSKKPLRKTLAWWGVSLSIAGILASCSMGFLYFKFYKYIWGTMESSQGLFYDGAPKEESAPQLGGLSKSDVELLLLNRWELSVPGAEGMCVGDWNTDGKPDLLVADDKSELHVIDTAGKEIEILNLPTFIPQIECGMIRGEPALLGYSNWSQEVIIVNRQGNKLWSYPCKSGVDGAHWGDLDGDGNDEMIVGLNGFGGLHGVSEDGKKLWQVTAIGNVWNQSIIPAREGRPATVFATEAGGSVWVFDGEGKRIRIIRPLKMYFSPIQAVEIDGKGTVQIVGIGEQLYGNKGSNVVAFDPQGATAWQTPIRLDHGSWRTSQFACGDIDGDGIREWAFVRVSGELVIASHQGKQIATMSVTGCPDQISIISLTSSKGILVLLQDGKISAYSAE